MRPNQVAEQAAGTTELARTSGFEGGRAMDLVTRGREVWGAMPVARRRKLIVCAAVIAAACALVGWWGTRTDWKTLYSGMEGRDLEQVEGELAAAGISYQTTPDGLGVQVPAELLDKARMEVATKGLPQSGRMGFELFDKPNWVGSEFDEQVNYQRALEGELERTIETLDSVREARVHLVLPKESLYTDQQQPAKASVVLKLKQQTLTREQVDSIRNLVAGAVAGLTPDHVTLVDADGRVNLNDPSASAAENDEEQAMADRLIAMLAPLAGRENVRATVNIAYDESSVDRTDDVVDPTQVATLASQKSTQTSGSATQPQGVAGTTSNTPTPDAKGKAQLPVYPTATTQPQSAVQESTTYAVSKHTTHEEIGPGRVARITAAVLINDRAVEVGVGKNEHTIWKPRTPVEMKQLEQLAQAAVGFDPKRGDEVVLENIGFDTNQAAPPLTGLAKTSDEVQSFLRQQPEMLRDLGAGLVAVLLILMVVRPVAKQTMALLSDQRELPALASGERAAALDAGRSARSLDSGAAVAARQDDEDDAFTPRKKRKHAAIDDDGVLEYVTAHIRREPTQSTRLLEAWIGTKERVS